MEENRERKIISRAKSSRYGVHAAINRCLAAAISTPPGSPKPAKLFLLHTNAVEELSGTNVIGIYNTRRTEVANKFPPEEKIIGKSRMSADGYSIRVHDFSSHIFE